MSKVRVDPRRRIRRGGRRARSELDDGLRAVSGRLSALSVRAGNAGRIRTAAALNLAILQMVRRPGTDSTRDHARLNLEVSYWLLGTKQAEKGDHGRAAAHLERALALNQVHVLEGLPTSVEEAKLLETLGDFCYLASQSLRSARYFVRLVKIRMGEGDKESELRARGKVVNSLADFAPKIDDSEFYFQLADHAGQLANLAADLDKDGLRAKALFHRSDGLVLGGARGDPVVETLEEGLRAWEGVPDSDESRYASVRFQIWLGQVLHHRGDFARALPRLREALEYQGPIKAGFCRRETLRHLTACLKSLDDFVAAERLLRTEIRCCEEEGSPYAEEFRSSLALNLAARGEIGAAVRMAEESLLAAEARYARGPDAAARDALGSVLQRLREIHNNHTRNYGRAAVYGRRSVEVARKRGDAMEEASHLLGLGIALLNDGGADNVTAAIGALRECLEACGRTAALRIEGAARRQLGRAHLRLGRHEEAAVECKAAVEIFCSCGDARRAIDTLEYLTAIPTLSPGQMAAQLRRITEIAAWTADPGRQAHALRELAKVRESVGLNEEAFEHLHRGIAVVEAARTRLDDAVDRGTLLETHAGLYADAADLAYRRREKRRAFQYAEAGRARLTLDRRAEEAARLIADPELRRRRKELAAEIAATTKRLEQVGVSWLMRDSSEPGATAPMEAEREEIEAELRQLEREWGQLESALAHGNPRFAAQVQAGIDSVWPVPRIQQELLGPESVLLEYLVSDERCLLFAITMEGFTTIELPISPSTLNRMVDELTRALDEVEPGYPHGNALYRALLAPAAALIEGRKEVLICPHGRLHRLPFAVLLREDPNEGGEEEGPYFANRWNELPYFLQEGMHIHYIASATTEGMLRLAERAEKPAYGKELLVLSAPLASSNGSLDKSFPPLRFADEEMASVSSPFAAHGVEALPPSADNPPPTKDGALKALDGHPSRYRYVHFVTHALIDHRTPWFSALLFEPAADNPTMPGYLRASEAIDLELPAECVTMSGCHTLGAAASASEGVVGLSLAFRYAGARSVCASLWRVADGSTAKLMGRFYESLASRDSTPAAALAEAQRHLIAETYHPRHWAAFGLYG